MIFRTPKTKNYTVMSNHHLLEKELTLKAKGLLTVILSLPENWDYTLEGLASICKESYGTIKNTVDELKEFGYIEVIKLLPNQTKSGRIEYEYLVHEKPKKSFVEQKNEKTRAKKQGVVLQGLEKQGLVFCGQSNTNKLNTKELNINKINTDVDVPGDESHPVEEQQQQPEDFIFVGIYKNVRISKFFYESFKNTYKYYKFVFNALSEYKKKKDITAHCSDEKYLSEWAIIDKERFEHEAEKCTFDVDDFFNAALERSYGKIIKS